MKKRILVLGAVILMVVSVVVHAQAFDAVPICLVSSGGLTFNMSVDTSTFNMTGTYSSSGGSGPAYGTLNNVTKAFTITWLASSPLFSGIYQGVWTGSGTSVTFRNDGGGSGIRTLSICTEEALDAPDFSDDE